MGLDTETIFFDFSLPGRRPLIIMVSLLQCRVRRANFGLVKLLNCENDYLTCAICELILYDAPERLSESITVLSLTSGIWEFSYIRVFTGEMPFEKEARNPSWLIYLHPPLLILQSMDAFIYRVPLHTNFTDGDLHVNLSLYILNQFLFLVQEIWFTFTKPFYKTHFTLCQFRSLACAIRSSKTSVGEELHRHYGHIIHIQTYNMTILKNFLFFICLWFIHTTVSIEHDAGNYNYRLLKLCCLLTYTLESHLSHRKYSNQLFKDLSVIAAFVFS